VSMQDIGQNERVPRKIILGPIEKAIATVAVAACIGLPSYLWRRSEASADDQKKALQAIDTRTQVMQQQIGTVVVQLQDFQTIRTNDAKQEVRLEAIESEVKELRAMRNLK